MRINLLVFTIIIHFMCNKFLIEIYHRNTCRLAIKLVGLYKFESTKQALEKKNCYRIENVIPIIIYLSKKY